MTFNLELEQLEQLARKARAANIKREGPNTPEEANYRAALVLAAPKLIEIAKKWEKIIEAKRRSNVAYSLDVAPLIIAKQWAELDELRRERAEWSDKINGTPCAQIAWQHERENLEARVEAAERKRDELQGRFDALEDAAKNVVIAQHSGFDLGPQIANLAAACDMVPVGQNEPKPVADLIEALTASRDAAITLLREARGTLDMGVRLVDYFANNRRSFVGSGTPATFDLAARSLCERIGAAGMQAQAALEANAAAIARPVSERRLR